ncbi:MAG: type II toxin-antitoxin system Phd/YefM family antitoxin [Idiomarina sp.]
MGFGTVNDLNDQKNGIESALDLLVTKKGKPAYEFQLETLALLKVIRLSEESLESGALELDDAFK